MTLYLKNNANRAAVVAIWFWIKNRNFEMILVKMVCKLLKSAKNKIKRQRCLCTPCCALKAVHKKYRYPFIFWQILTIDTPFKRELSHNFDFLFKIEIWKMQGDWFVFKVRNQTLAPVLSIFVAFQQFCPSFWRELSHKSKHVFKIKIELL